MMKRLLLTLVATAFMLVSLQGCGGPPAVKDPKVEGVGASNARPVASKEGGGQVRQPKAE
jgi:predicted small lipoprotein YifL